MEQRQIDFETKLEVPARGTQQVQGAGRVADLNSQQLVPADGAAEYSTDAGYPLHQPRKPVLAALHLRKQLRPWIACRA